MHADTIGAVLAGGRGRRMGADKPSLAVGRQTLVRHAVDALRSVGLGVALVLRPHQPVPLTAHTIAIVRDEIEDAGPLGGLEALLRWSPAEWVLVLACDQPLLTPSLLHELLAQPRGEADAVVARPRDQLEPLPGLYRRTSLPAVGRALARSECSLRDLLSALRLRELPAGALRRCDPQLLSFVNVNTPTDLEQARALVAHSASYRRLSGLPVGHRR